MAVWHARWAEWMSLLCCLLFLLLLLLCQDKSRPGEFQKAENLTIIPKESEVVQLPLDKFKQFFSPENLATIFGGSKSS